MSEIDRMINDGVHRWHMMFVLAPFYLAADNEKKVIVLSIRGTLSATDILTDINAVEDILESELFGRGYCHSGKFVYFNLECELDRPRSIRQQFLKKSLSLIFDCQRND